MDLFGTGVGEIVKEVWESLLGLKVLRCRPAADPEPAERCVIAAVTFKGRWRGRVVLSCPVGLGRRFASLMFGQCSGRMSLEDVQDALGELVNIISGNLKAMLPDRCRTSLPVSGLQEGPGDAPSLSSRRVLCSLPFEAEGRRFVVSVHEEENV